MIQSPNHDLADWSASGHRQNWIKHDKPCVEQEPHLTHDHVVNCAFL